MEQSQARVEGAHTESNVMRYEALVASRQRRIAERNLVFHELHQKYDNELRRLLPEAIRKSVAAICDEHRLTYDQSLAETIGHADQMDARRRKLLADLHQTLSCQVNNYAEIKRVHQAFANAFRGAVDATSHPAKWQIHAGDWAPSDLGEVWEFSPPYDLSDLFAFAGYIVGDHSGFGLFNRSSVDPRLGFISNDIIFFDDNRFLDRSDVYSTADSTVSVGVNFTAPRRGSLNVGLTMRNFYCRAHIDATNDFGLSSANIAVSHDVTLNMVRGDATVTAASQQMWPTDTGILADPGGDDKHIILPTPPAGPVTLATRIEGPPVEPGEHVQVLGGCETAVILRATNMDCTTPVALWWHVEKLRVWLSD